MSRRYRVVIQVSGGASAGETVLWEGMLEELRAKYGDDRDADPIESSDAAAYLTAWTVIQEETADGWQDCEDPRAPPSDRRPPRATSSSARDPEPDNVVPLHGLRPGQPHLVVGGLVDRTWVTLCLHGDDLDPSEITRIIGCEPTEAHRRGAPRPGPEVKIPWPSGAWLLRVTAEEPEGPEEATIRLLDRLPTDERLWRNLSEQYDLRISYGLFSRDWNRGFALSADLQRRLAGFYAELSFDMYANVD